MSMLAWYRMVSFGMVSCGMVLLACSHGGTVALLKELPLARRKGLKEVKGTIAVSH